MGELGYDMDCFYLKKRKDIHKLISVKLDK